MNEVIERLLQLNPTQLDRLILLVALVVIGMAMRAVIIMAKERK